MTQHMNSKIVGQLSPTDYDPDFFESKPYPFPYFDDKEIKVGFVEAEHQPYLDGADKALENFIGLGHCSSLLFRNIKIWLYETVGH